MNYQKTRGRGMGVISDPKQFVAYFSVPNEHFLKKDGMTTPQNCVPLSSLSKYWHLQNWPTPPKMVKIIKKNVSVVPSFWTPQGRLLVLGPNSSIVSENSVSLFCNKFFGVDRTPLFLKILRFPPQNKKCPKIDWMGRRGLRVKWKFANFVFFKTSRDLRTQKYAI